MKCTPFLPRNPVLIFFLSALRFSQPQRTDEGDDDKIDACKDSPMSNHERPTISPSRPIRERVLTDVVLSHDFGRIKLKLSGGKRGNGKISCACSRVRLSRIISRARRRAEMMICAFCAEMVTTVVFSVSASLYIFFFSLFSDSHNHFSQFVKR